MSKTYFKELQNSTKTGFWINNPTGVQVADAIAQGAVNCTTNPAYCAGLIKNEPEYLHSVIDEVLLTKTLDVEEACTLVYRQTAKRLMQAMLPVYEASGGKQGFVTIQADPRRDKDADFIVNEALEDRKLGPNFMAKIPVIDGALDAIERCLEMDIPVCATEVFSVAQAKEVCELHKRVCQKTGKATPIFVTHISGIFDEYIGKLLKREGRTVDPELLKQAGVSVAKREYAMLHENGYDTHMLGGGARAMHHFTELVGGDAHITINWSTAVEIMESDIEVSNRIGDMAPAAVTDALCRELPDFARAFNDNGLKTEEYAEFGPVQLFRCAFLKGWYALLSEIATRRHLQAL